MTQNTNEAVTNGRQSSHHFYCSHFGGNTSYEEWGVKNYKVISFIDSPKAKNPAIY